MQLPATRKLLTLLAVPSAYCAYGRFLRQENCHFPYQTTTVLGHCFDRMKSQHYKRCGDGPRAQREWSPCQKRDCSPVFQSPVCFLSQWRVTVPNDPPADHSTAPPPHTAFSCWKR